MDMPSLQTTEIDHIERIIVIRVHPGWKIVCLYLARALAALPNLNSCELCLFYQLGVIKAMIFAEHITV